MSDPIRPPDDQWEAAVQRMAVEMVYPPTPDIAGQVRQRLDRRAVKRPAMPTLRLAQAALVIALILAGLLTVPQVRAAVLRILQIGTIKITFDDPISPAATSTPDSGILESVLDLPDEATLAAARDALSFPILLPTYPADLGDPDHVFLIKSSTTAVALVWVDPADPTTPTLALFAFPPESNVWKSGMANGDELIIDGNHALWSEDPHLIDYEINNRKVQRIVDTSVLIWFTGDVTYRLEGAPTLEEALKIIQSLQ